MNREIIKINNLTKKFKKTLAVGGINFNINEGNISKVNRIFFSGNNNYSSSQLKSI